MTETISIQTIYLISASIGILAMIPQIKKLVTVKQSDGLSLTTWVVWGCCQTISFLYASSIGATAYMYVSTVWIAFYVTMVFLILKYRKRRGLIETLLYWRERGNEEKRNIVFNIEHLRKAFHSEQDKQKKGNRYLVK